MTATESGGLTYTLAPPDRTGILLGLHGSQVAVLAAAGTIGVIAMVVVHVAVGVAVVAGGVLVGFARVAGAPAIELVPAARRWLALRRRGETVWFRRLDSGGSLLSVDAPPMLAGQRILAVDTTEHGYPRTYGQAAVVHDTTTDRYAVSFRAAGTGVALLEPAARDQALAAWGTALDAFVRERSPIADIRWTESAAPAGNEAAIAHLDRHRAAEPVADAEATYRALLDDAGPIAVRHDITITLTVDSADIRPGRQRRADRGRLAVDTLMTEARLLAERLGHAGLTVTAPLTPAELVRTLRVRLDPTMRARLDRLDRHLDGTPRADSGDATSMVPLAVDARWTDVAVDGSFHRTYLVENWPRVDVPGNWLEPLLMWNGAIRTLTVVHTPIARSQSQREIIRSAAKLDGDAAERSRRGFRVGADIHHAADAVQRREHELIAGYGELGYVGLLTVTATSRDELDDIAAQLEMTAASVRIELRPLHGRHDAALVATLPLARATV